MKRGFFIYKVYIYYDIEDREKCFCYLCIEGDNRDGYVNIVFFNF